MIGTGHLLVGGAIGVTIGTVITNPVIGTPLAFGLGIASHHLLDMIPHTDPGTFWSEEEMQKPYPPHIKAIATAEVLLGFAITLAFFVYQHPTMIFLAGALGGMLPDLLLEIPLWKKSFRQSVVGSVWHYWHQKLHIAGMRNYWVTGLVVDALVVAGGFVYLLRFPAV